MKEDPLVSIIIPTYKGEDTVNRAIDSCLKQTYRNIEIIVVDDNDPDTQYREKTQSILKNYVNIDRIKYIKHDRNRNGSAARNTGFKNSMGKYICFLDDDDIFLDTKVEKQLKYLETKSKFDAVYCWRFQNGKIIKYDKTGDLSQEILSLTFSPSTCSIMIKRECFILLNGFDEKYYRHQDFEFLLRFFQSYTIGVVDEPLIGIIGNRVDNGLHGNMLLDLKKQFLGNFSTHIERIDKQQKGFKKFVYSRHYAAVFWDCISRAKFILAIKILFKYTVSYGLTFWKCLYLTFVLLINVKISNFFKKYQ